MKKLLLFLSISAFYILSANAQNCQAGFNFSVNGLTASFSDSSFSNTGNLSYSWSFGDGNFDTIPNPIHNYQQSGTYFVCLTISNRFCSDSICYNVQIQPQTPSCQADFYYFSNGLNVRLFDSSFYNSAISYFWDFDDGSSSNIQNPSHNYAQPGSYIISLTISDSSTNCFSQKFDTISVAIGSNCSAAFAFRTNQDTVFIQNQANNFDKIQYNFGDGTLSTNANPIHIYQQNGLYLICQTVEDTITGCSNTFCDTVTITTPTPCTADFTYNLTGRTLDITNKASNYNSILYDLGDGSTTSVPNPTYQYTTDGTYVVSQTISSQSGCSDVFYDTIIVQTPPPCSAGFSFSTSGLSVDFNDQSQNATTISYNFGDGNSSNSANPSYTYTNSGTYIVCQTVTGSNNCISTFCDTILVKLPIPCVADFSYNTINDTTQFTNLSQQFSRVSYDFGDGNFSSKINPTHSYDVSGQFQVKLIIYNDSTLCTDSITKQVTVTVSKSCVASFQLALDTNQKDLLYLVNTSSSDNTHSYFWDFGDGNTSTSRLPVHQFAENKAYKICLTVSDSLQNCTSTYCDSVGLDTNGGILKSGGFKLHVLDGSFIGIDEPNSFKQSVAVYPNPFQNQITIEAQIIQNAPFQLLSIDGRIIIDAILQNQFTTLPLDNMDPGIYFLRITHQGNIVTKRIIKH